MASNRNIGFGFMSRDSERRWSVGRSVCPSEYSEYCHKRDRNIISTVTEKYLKTDALQ